jgi:hypothetical protein
VTTTLIWQNIYFQAITLQVKTRSKTRTLTTPLSKTKSSVNSLTHILRVLPEVCSQRISTAYGRNISSDVLKGFSVRLTVEGDYFAVVTITNLGPPTSLVDHDFVLEDEFMEAQSDISALDALELLFEMVEKRSWIESEVRMVATKCVYLLGVQ